MKIKALISALAAAVVIGSLSGCNDKAATDTSAAAAPQEVQTVNWRLAETWGPNFPVFGYGFV